MNLTDNMLIHQNDHYMVVLLDKEEDNQFNYSVVNNQYGTLEYSCDALPEALTAAENFNHMMSTRSYLKEVEQAKEKLHGEGKDFRHTIQ